MKLVLIRHGITTSNEKRIYSGHSDVSLSEKGINELRRISQSYNFPKGDLFVSSPLKRCTETFDILYPGNNIYILFDDLKEINFGDWEGQSYQDLNGDTHYQKWIDNISDVTPPNGEGFKDFNKRIAKVFGEIVKYADLNNFKEIIVVTHGGVIRSIMSQIVDNSIDYFDWEIANGLGYQITIDEQYKYSKLKEK